MGTQLYRTGVQESTIRPVECGEFRIRGRPPPPRVSSKTPTTAAVTVSFLTPAVQQVR